MANYENLLEEWQFTPTEEEWTGVRVLLAKTGAAYSVPSIGDAFPAGELPAGYSSSNFTCRRINLTKPSGVERWECQYSTKPIGWDVAPDDEPESLQVSGEIVILKSNGNKNGVKDEDGKPVDKPRYAFLPTAQYSKVAVYTTFANAVTGISSATIGKLLEYTTGAGDGYWLYLGGDIQEYRNSEGDIVSKLTRKYAWKRYRVTGTDRGWNYEWNEKVGALQKFDPAPYQVVTTFPDTMPGLT